MNNSSLTPGGGPVRSRDIGRKDFLCTLGVSGALAAIGAGLPARQVNAQSSSASYEQVQNVLNHGADPRGVSDSVPAVNTAINALGGSGGTVHFPPGRYRLASTIKLDSSAKLKVRFTGAGVKADVSTIIVEGPYGFHANMGSLSVVAAPAFERLTFVAQNARATILRFFMVNHSVISQCTFNKAAIGVEYDANIRSAGYKSDASYHVMETGCRFCDNRVGVRVTDNEGGFEMFGGHVICNYQHSDIGVDIRGGWQHRIIGTKFEGTYNNGAGRGIGIRTRGNHGQFVGFQMESCRIGMLVEGGRDNMIQGFFSNGGDGMTAVQIASAASNTLLNVRTLRTSNAPIRNQSATTQQVATQNVPVA
jgi:hypothetical protein